MLTTSDCLFGPLACSDVLSRSDEPNDLVVPVEDDAALDMKVPNLAVLANDAVIALEGLMVHKGLADDAIHCLTVIRMQEPRECLEARRDRAGVHAEDTIHLV